MRIEIYFQSEQASALNLHSALVKEVPSHSVSAATTALVESRVLSRKPVSWWEVGREMGAPGALPSGNTVRRCDSAGSLREAEGVACALCSGFGRIPNLYTVLGVATITRECLGQQFPEIVAVFRQL